MIELNGIYFYSVRCELRSLEVDHRLTEMERKEAMRYKSLGYSPIDAAKMITEGRA